MLHLFISILVFASRFPLFTVFMLCKAHALAPERKKPHSTIEICNRQTQEWYQINKTKESYSPKHKIMLWCYTKHAKQTQLIYLKFNLEAIRKRLLGHESMQKDCRCFYFLFSLFLPYQCGLNMSMQGSKVLQCKIPLLCVQPSGPCR